LEGCMPARAITRRDAVGPSSPLSGQALPVRRGEKQPGGSLGATERGQRGCDVPVDLQEVVEALGQSDLAPASAQGASIFSRTGLPPGTAWDVDAELSGVIIPLVEADPFRGERCPWCRRVYPGEPEAGANQAPAAGDLCFIGRLIETAWEHKTGGDVQVGRCVYLLAFYLGLLPECGSEADLANHLGVDPAALSRSKLLLPPELQALCHLHHRPRRLRSPQL
jgi:hypothetical protein